MPIGIERHNKSAAILLLCQSIGTLLETRLLESLLQVAQQGSIAAAARRQGLTPAAVGQRIQALENELGIRLLERVGHTSRPTEACLRLLPHARELVTLADHLADKADMDGMSGFIRVGVISTLFQDLIPPVLRRINTELPGLRLHLVPGTSVELYSAFCRDEIDAALIVEPGFELPKAAAAEPLLSEPLVLITCQSMNCTIKDALGGNSYLRYDVNSWGGMIAEAFVRDLGLNLEPMVELDSLETIAILVGEGLGVSLVPRWHGIRRFASRIHISDPLPGAYDRSLCLIYPNKNRREPLWTAFRKLLGECAAGLVDN
ncbi:LysR family transcriptional regulator [Roseovarius atlanticus]|nr:LysR family transcriptional regulator [Roseovarius atlanticus]